MTLMQNAKEYSGQERMQNLNVGFFSGPAGILVVGYTAAPMLC